MEYKKTCVFEKSTRVLAEYCELGAARRDFLGGGAVLIRIHRCYEEADIMERSRTQGNTFCGLFGASKLLKIP